jgi:hypothetical protein
MIDAREAARLLGGEAHGHRVLCPGPGHSRTDRSLSLRFTPDAPDGFIVHSFAGDDWSACRDYVRERLGLAPADWRSRRSHVAPGGLRPIEAPDAHQAQRIERALAIWKGARDLRGTAAASYLQGRGLDVSEDLSHALRFSASLRLDAKPACGVIALMRDAIADDPCGIHRTYLHPDGRPVVEFFAECAPARCKGHKVRRMLGRTGAIKLDDAADVVSGLHVGEGIETCLTARQLGFRPVWALGSAGAIRVFPALAGIEAISVIEENDEASRRASAELCARYEAAGCEAFRIVVPAHANDLNDLVKGDA